jgi:hypothetical protein
MLILRIMNQWNYIGAVAVIYVVYLYFQYRARRADDCMRRTGGRGGLCGDLDFRYEGPLCKNNYAFANYYRPSCLPGMEVFNTHSLDMLNRD